MVADASTRADAGGDPFRHHPELRSLITPPEQSFFHDFEPSSIDARMAEMGRDPDWRYSDTQRDSDLAATLAGLPAGDLWVFAYGSLMWDPAFLFEEVRHAFVADCARRFILWDTGGRGSPDRPAVMAALDRGPGCHGLVFRVAGERLARELDRLWRRERIAPAYLPRMVTAETAPGEVTALTFVADHAAPSIRAELTREEQIEALATAEGMLGTNLAYIDNLKDHFDSMGIRDGEVDALHSAAHDRRGNPAR